MNDIIKKYLLLIFLFVNLTAEYYLFASISKIFFYISLAIGVPSLLFNFGSLREAFTSCKFLFGWCFVYVVYLFTAGQQYISQDNLLYLIAKLVSLGIMALCIFSTPSFYLRDITRPLGFVIVILLLLGYNSVNYQGLRSYGFYNPNAGCTIAAIGASCFLFQDRKLSALDWICLLFCVYCVLTGRSRNSLGMLIILVLFRYGLSFRLLVVSLVAFLVVFFILPEFGISVPAVDRILGTLNGTVSLDREIQRDMAKQMIQKHPFIGHGFEYTDYLLAQDSLGAHNGYLSIIVQMGYVFGSLWLLFLALQVLSLLPLLRRSNIFIQRHLAIVCMVLLSAMFEDFFIGVNSITTNLFVISLIVLSIHKKDDYLIEIECDEKNA